MRVQQAMDLPSSQRCVTKSGAWLAGPEEIAIRRQNLGNAERQDPRVAQPAIA